MALCHMQHVWVQGPARAPVRLASSRAPPAHYTKRDVQRCIPGRHVLAPAAFGGGDPASSNSSSSSSSSSTSASTSSPSSSSSSSANPLEALRRTRDPRQRAALMQQLDGGWREHTDSYRPTAVEEHLAQELSLTPYNVMMLAVQVRGVCAVGAGGVCCCECCWCVRWAFVERTWRTCCFAELWVMPTRQVGAYTYVLRHVACVVVGGAYSVMIGVGTPNHAGTGRRNCLRHRKARRPLAQSSCMQGVSCFAVGTHALT